MHVCYIPSHQTMAKHYGKARTKHHVVESNVTWMDIRSGACESKQNGRPVHQYGCHSNSVSPRRGCFTKKACFKLSDCSAEAICRSSWPICCCLEKSYRAHRHTHTANYCNLAAHARRGLITATCHFNYIGPAAIVTVTKLTACPQCHTSKYIYIYIAYPGCSNEPCWCVLIVVWHLLI